MEQILILASILMSGYLAHRIFSEQPVAFRLMGGLVLFISTVALSGFAAGSIGAAVNGIAVFIGSAVLLSIGLTVATGRHKNARPIGAAAEHMATGTTPQTRHTGTWVFLLTLFAWLAFSLAGSSGQTTPHGYSVDAAAHYALVRYLYDFSRLPGSDWHFLWEIADYPFGFHLTTAIIARLLNTSPYYVMWIFAVLLMGVVVASVATMIHADNSGRGRRGILASLWVVAMFATSPYITEAYSGSGFYPMVLGLVYIVAFIWFLRNVGVVQQGTVLFVTIAFCGMALSYPQWLPIVFLFYLYTVIQDPQATTRRRVIYLLVPGIFSGAVGLAFLVQHWKGLRYIYNIEGTVEQNSHYLLLLALSALAVMYNLWRDQRRRYWVAALVAIAQVLLVVINKSIDGLGGMYPIYKYAYVLTPILILMLAQGLVFEKGQGGYARYKPILAIAVLFAIILSPTLHQGRTWKTHPFISAGQFHAFEWAKQNVASDSIYYFGFPPVPLFGYAITGKPQAHAKFGWWVQPSLTLPQWVSQASSGEAAVVTLGDGDVKTYIDNGKLKLLYRADSAYVVEKP